MRGRLRAYSVALFALAAAVLLRWLLDPVLGEALPLVTLFGAVAAAVWVGGYRPAVVVAVAGYVACAYLFIQPRGELGLNNLSNLVGFVAYLFTCSLIIAIGEAARRARAQADERSELLRVTLASIGDAVITTDTGGRVTYLNAVAESLTGWPLREALGQPLAAVFRVVDEHTREPVDSPALRALQEGAVAALATNTVLIARDGAERSIDDSAAPIAHERGRVAGAVLIFRDVTAQRRVEAQRQRFVALAESSTDFIGICSLDGVPLYINPAGLRLVGLDSVEQARQTHVRDFFLPEDQSRIVDELFPEVTAKGHGETEVRFRNFRTGDTRWMAYKVLTLSDADGRSEGYATVSQDITDRRRMEDDLRKLAADLSLADRQKNEFLATLAHELRNPLAPLANMLEILKRSRSEETLRNAVETMDRQLGQLVRLVDDLLDLSRITHDRLELRRSRVELGGLIEQALETTRVLADEAGHEVMVRGPREPIYVLADAVRLAQVFGNLLNNSYKYTNPGGKVTVTWERQGDEAVVTVADTGAGIPSDKLDSIFDMFAQVDSSIERSRGGLGIGLTLVRRLVQMHGGSVEARSRGEGRGSEFVVRLPVAGGAAAAVEPSIAARSVPQVAPPRRILVVDDNHDAASSLALLLQLAGHQTYTAFDGPEALAAAERHRPEVVLLDIGLPMLNGYEVCRRIRAQPWGQEMAIVALTGWGQDDDRQRSREAGFDGHLVKPVARAALEALLASLPVGS